MIKLKKTKIIKKHTKKFKRHHSDRYHRVSENWRKQKGIDSCVRRRFRGTISQPRIGYGSNKKTRHISTNGFKNILIRNPKDLETLLMHNKTFAGVIAHNISAKKRVIIVEEAKKLNVKITNPKAKITLQP